MGGMRKTKSASIRLVENSDVAGMLENEVRKYKARQK